jgi:hypothetical protein
MSPLGLPSSLPYSKRLAVDLNPSAFVTVFTLVVFVRSSLTDVVEGLFLRVTFTACTCMWVVGIFIAMVVMSMHGRTVFNVFGVV